MLLETHTHAHTHIGLFLLQVHIMHVHQWIFGLRIFLEVCCHYWFKHRTGKIQQEKRLKTLRRHGQIKKCFPP